MIKTDEELALLAQEGNEECAEELLRRYKQMVVKCGRPYYIAGADEDDIIQEGMIGLYKAVLKYRAGESKFITYAYQCVHTSILDAVKKAKRLKHQPLNNYVSSDSDIEFSKEESPQVLIEQVEARAELIEAFKKSFSDKEYSVFEQYIAGKSISEIANSLGVSYKTVDNALQRIRRKARQVTEEHLR